MRSFSSITLAIAVSPLVAAACGGGAFTGGDASAGAGGSSEAGQAGASDTGRGGSSGGAAGQSAGTGGTTGTAGASGQTQTGGSAGHIQGGGSAGTTGVAGSAGAAGATIGSCNASSPEYHCNASLLQKCDVSTGTYATVKTCPSIQLCDGTRGQCDVCKAGDADPAGKCATDKAQSVCNETLDGYGLAKDCPAGASQCSDNQCVGCSSDADCPPATNACQTAHCGDGQKCGFANLPDTTPDPTGPVTACSTSVCDGNGKDRPAYLPANTVVDASNPCATTVCDAMGNVVPTTATAGTTCGDQAVCDGSGHCAGYLSAPIDPDGKSAQPAVADDLLCIQDSTPPDAGIFVSQTSGNDTHSGAQDAPVQTVTQAVTLAVKTHTAHIYVEEGTYKESVTVADAGVDLLIEGGWLLKSDATWRRDCAAAAYGAVVIQEPPVISGPGMTVPAATVVVDTQSHGVELRNLTIKGPDYATIAPVDEHGGESSIGVWVSSGTSLKLTAVEVIAEAARAGGAGTKGEPGGAPPASCANQGTGADGKPSVVKPPISAGGEFTAAGFVQYPGTTYGVTGEAGSNGKLGIYNGAQVTCEVGSVCLVFGGACSAGTWTPSHTTSKLATLGCGSPGSGPGSCGWGGGASVGLAQFTATPVTAVAARVAAGSAGPGGPGGVGGDTLPGSLSIAGANQECDDGTCGVGTGFGCTGTCAQGCRANFTTVVGQQAAANGGRGANGSHGPLANGGPSIGRCYVGGDTAFAGSPSTLVFATHAPALGATAGEVVQTGPCMLSIPRSDLRKTPLLVALLLSACDPPFHDVDCVDPVTGARALCASLVGGNGGQAGSSGASPMPSGAAGASAQGGTAGAFPDGGAAGTGGTSLSGAAGALSSGTSGTGGTGGSAGAPLCTTDCAFIVDVAVADTHGCALRKDDTVICWGNNLHGQLGIGTLDATTPSTAMPVSKLLAVSIAAGGSTTCAVDTMGVVSCWGDNEFGQLGSGSIAGSSHAVSPTVVSNLGPASRVAVGPKHACATLNDGTLRCWGDDTGGQLDAKVGAATIATKDTELGATSSTSVALGLLRTCVTTAAGMVDCVGSNAFAADDSAATVASGIIDQSSAAAEIALGDYFGCFRSTGDGNVSCWGRSDEGELANGEASMSDRTRSALLAATFDGAVSIAAGSTHACVALATGDVLCWGACDQGQCGASAAVGATAASGSPSPVTGIPTIRAVRAGGRSTCAITMSGALYCWGSITASSVPIAITFP